MTNTNIFTTNSSPVQSAENEFLSEVISGIVDEAVRHFNSPRKRKREDDERYFFNKEEVDAVMSRLTHPENVKCIEDRDKNGNIFCYILDFKVLATETRNRTKRVSA